MSVFRALKAYGAQARIVALEPMSSAVLATGTGGSYRVDETATGFRPPHLKSGERDEARAIEEQEARAMARRLA